MGMPVSRRSTAAVARTRSSYALVGRGAGAGRLLVAITVAAHTSLGRYPIHAFGSEEQRAEWLPDSARARGWVRSD